MDNFIFNMFGMLVLFMFLVIIGGGISQCWHETLPTKDYIHTLEQLCNNQSEVCKVYLEVIELQIGRASCRERV